ncbi:MAG: STAS domain-containing protein [Chlorobi bacterium]|nr:STAS domain-containing protein [Chlorobiota bacterium]
MLKISNYNQDYSVSFNGIKRINITNASRFKDALLPIVTTQNNKITIDFNEVNFIDSSGFQVLITILKASELYNSHIEVMNVSDDLKELFDLLNLSDVFQIAAN